MPWIRHYMKATMPSISIADTPLVHVPEESMSPSSDLRCIGTFSATRLTEEVQKFYTDTPPLDAVEPTILKLIPPRARGNRKAFLIRPSHPADEVAKYYASFGPLNSIANVFDEFVLPTIAYLMHPRSLAPRSQFNMGNVWRDGTNLGDYERTPGIQGECRWKYFWERLAANGTPAFEKRMGEKRILRHDMSAWLWTPFDADAGTGNALLVASPPSLLTPAVFKYLIANRELSATSKSQSKHAVPVDDGAEVLANDYMKRIVNCCVKVKTRHFIVTTQNTWAFGVFPSLTPTNEVDYSYVELSSPMEYNSEMFEEGMAPLPEKGATEAHWTIGVLPTVMYWLDKAMRADALPDAFPQPEDDCESMDFDMLSEPATQGLRKRTRELEIDDDSDLSDEHEAPPNVKRPRHAPHPTAVVARKDATTQREAATHGPKQRSPQPSQVLSSRAQPRKPKPVHRDEEEVVGFTTTDIRRKAIAAQYGKAPPLITLPRVCESSIDVHMRDVPLTPRAYRGFPRFSSSPPQLGSRRRAMQLEVK